MLVIKNFLLNSSPKITLFWGQLPPPGHMAALGDAHVQWQVRWMYKGRQFRRSIPVPELPMGFAKAWAWLHPSSTSPSAQSCFPPWSTGWHQAQSWISLPPKNLGPRVYFLLPYPGAMYGGWAASSWCEDLIQILSSQLTVALSWALQTQTWARKVSCENGSWESILSWGL